MSDYYPHVYNLREPLPPLAYGEPEIIEGELNYKDIIQCPIDRTGERSDMIFKNLSMFAGNNKTWVCYVKDRWLNPINIYGGVGIMTVKNEKSDVTPLIQKSTNMTGQGAIGSSEQGEMYFYFVPVDTTNLEEKQYVFDIKLEINSKVYTVAEGVIGIQIPVNK